MRTLVTAVCVIGALTAGCTTRDRAASARGALLPVSLPDLSRSDEAVQAQARQLHAALTETLENRRAPTADVAAAYGKLGMLFHAAEYLDAAAPCYMNARQLDPGEMRWPYYLGLLLTNKGDSQNAEKAFVRVLELRPNDLPALIHLGRLHLDGGRLEAAEPLFTKAFAIEPRAVAALAGLGRAALARRDYALAATHLERAFTIDPTADSLHAPLAMAYRGLGQLDKAEPHVKQWRNRDILVPDPLKLELDLLLESSLSYELRGVRALESRAWPEAAGFFRRGLALTHDNTPLRRSLQHKLGTALYMAGDARGAVEQFEDVVRLAPPDGVDESTAKAHYSLGVFKASNGQGQQAVAHLTAAVKYQPSYVEAHLALADALRRIGRVDASLPHYQEAVNINPLAAQARLGYAVALIRLRRYHQARDWLNDALTRHPDDPTFPSVLARLLAAAPDDRVRDGERSLALAQELFKTNKRTDLGETMAMAHAELGEYEKAAIIQRAVMDASKQAGRRDSFARMAENLRLYERRQPCRTPWTDDDPVHNPGPPVNLNEKR